MLRLPKASVAACLGLAFVCLPAGAAAHGTLRPPHQVGRVECVAGGIMRAYPPRLMRPTTPTDDRNPEQVFWRPTLYRRYRRAGKILWRRVAIGPRLFAFTSSYGFYQGQLQQAWHYQSNPGSQVLFYPFKGLGRGTYRIKHYLHWAWGPSTWHVHLQGRCTFV
jgi:hypothetical protein